MSQNNTLHRYEPYMEAWCASLPRIGSKQDFKSRYHTFYHVFEKLAAMPQDRTVRILELGTSRSFVDGAFPGCNSDDTSYWTPNDISRWDHGAGSFTYLCAEYMNANHPNFELHTVDLSRDHIARVKHMTQPFAAHIRYYVSDSVQFLQNFRTRCELIYLDTGDMTPIEPTAQLQLREAQVLVQERLVNPDGFLLIDDVRHPAALAQSDGNDFGKAKYSIPFLQQNGFKTVMDEYQVLFTPPL